MKKLAITIVLAMCFCFNTFGYESKDDYVSNDVEYTIIGGEIFINMTKENIDKLKEICDIYYEFILANENKTIDIGKTEEVDIYTIDYYLTRLNEYYNEFLKENAKLSDSQVMMNNFELTNISMRLEAFEEEDNYNDVLLFAYKMTWLNECMDDTDLTERNKTMEEIKPLYEKANK